MSHFLKLYDRQLRIGPKQLSEASGIHEELILELGRIGLLHSEDTGIHGEPVFTGAAVYRCREIDRLHRLQHLSYHFIRRFLEMQERLERAEKALEENRVGGKGFSIRPS